MNNNQVEIHQSYNKNTVEELTDRHLKISKLREKYKNIEEDLKENIHKAFWIMLEQKEETQIRAGMVLKENKILDKLNAQDAELKRITELPDETEENLKSICKDKYKGLINKIMRRARSLNRTYFYRTGTSTIKNHPTGKKNIKYKIEKDEIHLNNDKPRIIHMKEKEAEDKIKLHKNSSRIKEVQETIIKKLEKAEKKVRELNELILDKLGEKIVSHRI